MTGNEIWKVELGLPAIQNSRTQRRVSHAEMNTIMIASISLYFEAVKGKTKQIHQARWARPGG